MDEQRDEHARQDAAEQQLVHHVREVVAEVVGVADRPDAERGDQQAAAQEAGDPAGQAGDRHRPAVGHQRGLAGGRRRLRGRVLGGARPPAVPPARRRGPGPGRSVRRRTCRSGATGAARRRSSCSTGRRRRRCASQSWTSSADEIGSGSAGVGGTNGRPPEAYRDGRLQSSAGVITAESAARRHREPRYGASGSVTGGWGPALAAAHPPADRADAADTQRDRQDDRGDRRDRDADGAEGRVADGQVHRIAADRHPVQGRDA